MADGSAVAWDVGTGGKIVRLGEYYWQASAAFSPDGTRVVTGADSGGPFRAAGTIILWDGRTGDQLFTRKEHGGGINSVAFSPDGSRFITASNDRTAIIWDARTGDKVRTLIGHKKAVHSAAFSPDGNQVVTGGDDGTVIIWNAETGDELLPLTGHQGTVFSVAYSPDGREILTASRDGTARIWAAGPKSKEDLLEGGQRFSEPTTAVKPGDGRSAEEIFRLLWDNELPGVRR